ncbi:hypothetical protein ACHAWF_004664 [Thalassiosira exigua]
MYHSSLLVSLTLLAMNHSNNVDEGPAGRTAGNPKVVIVGGGFAGLSAAYRLLNQDRAAIDVEIVEARDRIGGRVHPHSLRDEGDDHGVDEENDVWVDLGGQWVHEASEANPIRRLMDEFGLPFCDQDLDSAIGVDRDDEVDGQHRKSRVFDEEGRELSKEVFGMANELFQEATEEYDKDEITVDTSKRDLLDRRLQLEKARTAISDDLWPDFDRLLAYTVHRNECYEGGALHELSPVLDSLYVHKGGPDRVPRGTYRLLLTKLREKIGMGRVRLNCKVKRIEYCSEDDELPSNGADGNCKEVVIRARGEDGDDIVIRGDYCICAVPLGVLQGRQVEFCPKLPVSHIKALDAMGMGLLDKIILRFETKFWKDVGTKRFGVAHSDPARTKAFYDASPEVGAPVLICFLGGSAADRLEAELTDDPAIEEAMECLRVIFGTGRVPNSPVSSRVTRWRADPLARGSYSYERVGSTEADYDVVASPLGSLLFAGEHTSKESHATVHGAWESGQREAERILQTLLRKERNK